MAKVRIAVYIDKYGNWSSAGWSEAKDDSLFQAADMFYWGDRFDDKAYAPHLFWIEADIEVPDEPTIQASVAEAA